MYNPAKISSTRTPHPLEEEGVLNIQYTVSVINVAMHYIYVLISLYILHIKKNRTKQKQKNQKTKHSIFFNFYTF